jgi:hypothetical protein
MTPMRIQLLQEQAHMSGNFMGHFLVEDALPKSRGGVDRKSPPFQGLIIVSDLAQFRS